MTGEVVYMFAMSLDGFIARHDGSFDWLNDFPADADFDFDDFLASVTGIVMGRGSYDAATRDGGWDYGRWPCAVATHRPIANPPTRVFAIDEGPAAILEALRANGSGGRVWLFGGGEIARQFIDAGLLDTIEIGTIPVILGEGIPAFGAIGKDCWLDLDFSRPLKNGAVHTRYRVRKSS